MRLIDADALMEKLNGIWDCNDMTFESVDGCCIDADCKSCRWRETIEYVKRLVQNQTTISSWHRVKEPPKEHMWCFVYTHDPEMIMPIRIAFYVASCTGKGLWLHYESVEDIGDEVDYWMPMYLEGPDVDKDLPWPIEPLKED